MRIRANSRPERDALRALWACRDPGRASVRASDRDDLTRQAADLASQAEVDELFAEISLPVRGGCGNEVADAA